jgi:pyridoxamine 5'-phosphate oxidase
MQQINFQGTVTKLPHNISDEIFNERPLAAQAVATISTQSAPMTNEQKLRTEVLKLLTQQEPMSRPKTWHAYHIEIETIEFWHGSKDRFHHRLRYELKNKIWQHLKLQP